MSKRIAIGSDHRGFLLKQTVMPFLTELGHSFHDFGSYDSIPVDYPDVAEKVGLAVAAGDFDQGILICGTGIGMCIAANKIRGVRAAMCHSTFEAERARRHNDANVLCLSGEGIDADLARGIVRAFLSTDFEGGRHTQRVEKIRGLETGPN